MLKRKIEEDLMVWKKSINKKCLIIEGARQGRKTYIIKHFAEQNYENYIEFNFVSTLSLCKIFVRLYSC